MSLYSKILQSSYLAQWARTINLIILLISPNGLERLITSDFSELNPFRAEDFCSIIIETFTEQPPVNIGVVTEWYRSGIGTDKEPESHN